MNMFSEALRIMDHNLERMMVEEIRKECEAKLKAAKTEFKTMADERINAIIEAKAQETNKAEIFRLRLLGKSAEGITQELSLPSDTVKEISSTVNQ